MTNTANTDMVPAPRDRGAISIAAALWLAAALGLGAVAFTIGYLGGFGGGDDSGDGVDTGVTEVGVGPLDEVAGAVSTRADVAYRDCPNGRAAGFLRPGARVLAVAKSADGAWIAVRSPDDVGAVAWLPVSAVTPDPATGFAGLPTSGCSVVGYDPVIAGQFTGRVVDSVSGAPLGGVTISWDGAGDFIPDGPETAITAADGTFTLVLSGEEYGLIIDGNAIGYEVGYLGASDPLPTGWQVFPTWGEASTWLPTPLGDIALDAAGAPAPTTTSTTAPTTVPGTDPPNTTNTTNSTAPTTTTTPNAAPVIGNLSASPSVITAGPSCGSTLLAVNVTDPTGVVSVTVAWSYTRFNGSQASGTITLAHVQGGDTWQATFAPQFDPPNDGSPVQLVVTATDAQGLSANRSFPQTLAVQYCLI